MVAEPLENPHGMKMKLLFVEPPKSGRRIPYTISSSEPANLTHILAVMEDADGAEANSGLEQRVMNIAPVGCTIDEIQRNMLREHDEILRARLLNAGGCHYTR